MISNGEGWHYVAVKMLSPLLREITCCLNCLHSFRTIRRLEFHKKVCENKGFSRVDMLSEETKIYIYINRVPSQSRI